VADFFNIFKALNNLEVLAGNDPQGAGPAVVFLVHVVGVPVNAPARFHLVVGALLAGKSKAVASGLVEKFLVRPELHNYTIR
jgi:hypothetical protein